MKQIAQWNRIENPEINPHKQSQLISDKAVNTVQGRKASLSRNGFQTTGHLNVKKKTKNKKLNLETGFITITKLNFKMDHTPKCKT